MLCSACTSWPDNTPRLVVSHGRPGTRRDARGYKARRTDPIAGTITGRADPKADPGAAGGEQQDTVRGEQKLRPDRVRDGGAAGAADKRTRGASSLTRQGKWQWAKRGDALDTAALAGKIETPCTWSHLPGACLPVAGLGSVHDFPLSLLHESQRGCPPSSRNAARTRPSARVTIDGSHGPSPAPLPTSMAAVTSMREA